MGVKADNKPAPVESRQILVKQLSDRNGLGDEVKGKITFKPNCCIELEKLLMSQTITLSIQIMSTP